eukprot:GEZU01013214.1.p1 GENE.GEZU01013214.1~~GEZU01013214.1.p1  ORF type:complete len:128 (+),score=34.68 GEZU01013214.1:108-491(+)
MSEKKKDFDPPIFIGSSMFGGDSSDEEDSTAENQLEADATRYEIKTHNYAGETIRIREFDFHQTNANFVWPASKTLAEFMVAPENLPLFQNKTIIELGWLVPNTLYMSLSESENSSSSNSKYSLMYA